MARHKNTQWFLTEKPGRNADGSESYSSSTIQMALLMDIRDELRDLNLLLNCHRFLSIPIQLEAIRRNTAKKREKIRRA
jgi:hypothetical protein